MQPARVLRRAHSLDRVPCGEDRNFGTPETLNLSLAGFPFREVAVGLVRKVEGRLEMLLDLLDSAQIGVDRVAALRLLGGPAACQDEHREENYTAERSAHNGYLRSTTVETLPSR